MKKWEYMLGNVLIYHGRRPGYLILRDETLRISICRFFNDFLAPGQAMDLTSVYFYANVAQETHQL